MERELTENEKRVLHLLITHPTKNDRELGDISGLNTSTLSTTKKRLASQEFFTTMSIPKIHKLGYRLMTASYYTFNPLLPQTHRIVLEKKITDKYKMFPIRFSGLNQSIMLGAGRDFTRMMSAFNDIETFFYTNQLLDGVKLEKAYFPFEGTRINRLLDFGGILNRKFALGSDSAPDRRQVDLHNEKNVFNAREREVFHHLIKYPDHSDTNLSKTVGVHRHTISKVRKKVEEMDLVKRVKIPNLGKLGFKIMAFSHMKFKPESNMQIRKSCMDWLLNDMPAFLNMETDRETVTLYAFENFDEYKIKMTAINKKFFRSNHISKEPENLLFSFNQMNFFENINFLPLIKDDKDANSD
jgi:DNA-binding MarR family transcriptional regulator